MSAQPTPGPWTAKSHAAPRADNGDIGIINGKGMLVAVAYSNRCTRDNASLIAACDPNTIRELIADCIPGFENFNQRLQHPGGFYLGNPAARREWRTSSGRAQFSANPLPASLLDPRAGNGAAPDLILQTLRSHDQYNTTIYGLDDRYRGVRGQREVLFVNAEDIRRLGFEPGQRVDIETLWNDGVERRVCGFTLLAYDVPPGQAAAYYPETNPLVPLQSHGRESFTPTSKSIAVRLRAHVADARIA